MRQQIELEYAKALDGLARMHDEGELGDAEYELKRSRLVAEAAKRKGSLGSMVLAAVIVLLALSGWAIASTAGSGARPVTSDLTTAPAQPTTFTIRGTVDVPGKLWLRTTAADQPCSGDDGYDDVAAGAQVTVLDPAGVKLAVATLGSGLSHEGSIEGRFQLCRHSFSVTGVTEGESLYGLQVGRSARGSVSFTRAELEMPARITIG